MLSLWYELFQKVFIKENGRLLDLNLMCNDIGPTGAEHLGNALQVNYHSIHSYNFDILIYIHF